MVRKSCCRIMLSSHSIDRRRILYASCPLGSKQPGTERPTPQKGQPAGLLVPLETKGKCLCDPKPHVVFGFRLTRLRSFVGQCLLDGIALVPLSMRKRDQSAGAGGHTVVALAVTEKRPTAVELQQCNTMHLYISVNKITYMGGPLGHYLHTQ